MPRHAATVLDMVRGTMYGPTRRAPFSRSVSAASTVLAVEAPPEPATSPVRGFEISTSVRPASAMASAMAMWA